MLDKSESVLLVVIGLYFTATPVFAKIIPISPNTCENNMNIENYRLDFIFTIMGMGGMLHFLRNDLIWYDFPDYKESGYRRLYIL